MNRKQAISFLRIAGYHGDNAAYMRIYCENRISKQVADDAWREGVELKKAGMNCECWECKKAF